MGFCRVIGLLDISGKGTCGLLEVPGVLEVSSASFSARDTHAPNIRDIGEPPSPRRGLVEKFLKYFVTHTDMTPLPGNNRHMILCRHAIRIVQDRGFCSAGRKNRR
jgi:hypothetical protein